MSGARRDRASTAPPRIVLPVDRDEGDVTAFVEFVQRVIGRHPVAAQAAFRALAAEGRRFAATAAGRDWQVRVERSVELRRLRPLWETASWNLLDDRDAAPLPGQLVDLAAHALSRADLEALVAAIHEGLPPPGADP